MVRVLVVEDEPDVAEVLSYNLRTAGFDPVIASSGRDALRVSEANRPDIVLLDLMLPDISGMQVCRMLKSNDATRSIPVVIVSARSDEIDRVVGFEVGADDYVTKPYSTRELLLRIRRSLDRHRIERADKDILVCGLIRMDLGSHRVWVAEAAVELRITEYKLLQCLCEYASRVLTRERLRELVWGGVSTVALRTVDAHVKRLRDRLGAAGAQIETVRGVGYRMTDARTPQRLDGPETRIAIADGDNIV